MTHQGGIQQPPPQPSFGCAAPSPPGVGFCPLPGSTRARRPIWASPRTPPEDNGVQSCASQLARAHSRSWRCFHPGWHQAGEISSRQWRPSQVTEPWQCLPPSPREFSQSHHTHSPQRRRRSHRPLPKPHTLHSHEGRTPSFVKSYLRGHVTRVGNATQPSARVFGENSASSSDLSQNHRMFGVGRDLCGSPSPTPC